MNMATWNSCVRSLSAASLLLVAACSPSPRASDEDCRLTAGYAEMVMRQRQDGGDATDAMQQAGGAEPLREIVRQAYAEPLYSTDAGKNRAVTEFKNRAFMGCMGQ